MELLLELHCVNNEGCFYVLLLGLLREDTRHLNSLPYFFFFFLTCSIATAFKFRVINGEGGLRVGIQERKTHYSPFIVLTSLLLSLFLFIL